MRHVRMLMLCMVAAFVSAAAVAPARWRAKSPIRRKKRRYSTTVLVKQPKGSCPMVNSGESSNLQANGSSACGHRQKHTGRG